MKKRCWSWRMALIILENSLKDGESFGQLVFNSSMTGYQKS